MNEAQSIVLIRGLNQAIFESEPSSISKNFSSEKELIDPLIAYIKDQPSHILRNYAGEVIKTLGFKAP